MKVVKERSRLIVTDFTDSDKGDIEKIVSTMDNIFIYENDDKDIIYLPTGLEKIIKTKFKVNIDDRSNTYWDYATITKPNGIAFKPRDQMQKDVINFTLENAKKGNNVAMIVPPGGGKGHGYSTKIPTPTDKGWTSMSDLKVGDYVFDRTGNPTKVLNIFELGESDIYKITFNDGRYSLCTNEHLWSVKDSIDGEYKIMTTDVLLEDYNSNNKFEKYIPICEPVQYQSKDVPFDPYYAGVLIANGLCDYIPDGYLYNDIEIRTKLVKGVFENCTLPFESSSKEILRQLQQIIFSLGINCLLQYKDNIGILLFNDDKQLQMKSIQLVKREQARCIMVDNQEHLYLTEDYIVTHNTSMTIACMLEVGMRSLIIVPTTNIRRQWKDSLIKMFGVSPDNITEIDSPDKFINVKTDFCIILQASLNSLNKKYDLEKIMKDNKFGIKVIDEAHMYFHNTIKIDGSSNIKNNWYLTATFGRSSEDEDKLYRQMFSNIEIFRVKDKDPTLFNRKPGTIYGHKPHTNCIMYWAPSGLTAEEIKSISTSKRYNEKEGKWMRYGISVPKYTALVIPPDKKTVYIEKILKVVKIASKVPYGRMLILSPTIESVEILAKHIREIFPKYLVGTIHSHNSKEDNDITKDKADILISTVKSSGTGFDVKDLSTLVVVEQFKSLILTEQVSGRLRRRPDGKDTFMYDIVDASVPQLRSWAANRASLLKRKSKKFTVIDL